MNEFLCLAQNELTASADQIGRDLLLARAIPDGQNAMKATLIQTHDPRWTILAQIQTAREAIGIRPRSLTVLRGLLSFVTPAKWHAGELIVFPSNRALQERCDAMDERTLRRHLAHLCAAGVIQRKLSPNRKRYAVRDETGAMLMCYGFDLSGLKAHAERIASLAEDAKQQALRLRSLRSVLRHLLWESRSSDAELHKLLRNKTSTIQLEAAIESLRNTPQMTDSHGQNDLHIQNSDKEINEEPTTASITEAITVSECADAAQSAVELSLTPVRTWSDLEHLAEALAPALGLKSDLQKNARQNLGPKGYTLAVLGLVQAFERIKNVPRYLATLSQKAENGEINILKMFRSLTRSHPFPAGNQ